MKQAASRVAASNTELDSLKQLITKKEGEQSDLQMQLAKAQATATQSSTALATHRARLAELNVQAGLPSESIQQLVDAVAAASRDAAQAAGHAAQLAAQLNATNEALGSLATTVSQLRSQQQGLQNQLNEALSAAKQAEAELTKAQQFVDAADAERVQAENALKQATEASKPNNINLKLLSPPTVVTVQPAVAQITATATDGGNVKRGGNNQVTVQVTRKNNFSGPLTLSLAPDAAATGLSWDPVTIANDQNSAVLTVQAAADAAIGPRPNLVVRASGMVEGQLRACDAPIALTISE